jgi:hypothetical protein
VAVTSNRPGEELQAYTPVMSGAAVAIPARSVVTLVTPFSGSG